MGIPTLSDITSGMTGSTESATSDDSDDAEIPAIFGNLGADLDRVEQFYEQRGSDDHERLVQLAERLDDDEEAWFTLEEYRSLVDAKRLDYNFLKGRREGPFVQAWTDALYYGDGDSDNPGEGSLNAVAERVREDDDLNLPLYKVMFPAPQEEYWQGEPVNVVNHLDKWDEIGIAGEDGVQDSYIFMPREFVDSYMEYANDDGVPLPPAEHPEGGDDSGTQTTFEGDYDPSSRTVEQLKDEVQEMDDFDAVTDVLVAEKTGDARKTAIKAINRRLSELA